MGEIIIYKPDDGGKVTVRLEGESLWVTQDQMAELFDRERSVITKHIRNVFRENELEERSVCANFAHTAEDGKTYKTQHYNLDKREIYAHRHKPGAELAYRGTGYGCMVAVLITKSRPG